jgi:hypothetical protein
MKKLTVVQFVKFKVGPEHKVIVATLRRIG